MRLTDLNPRWLYKDGVRVGFIFTSPIKPEYKQTCFFVPVGGFSSQLSIVAESLKVDGDDCHDWQGCKKDYAWQCLQPDRTTPKPVEDADFETLTVMPSLDGSPGGLWHGFITNGEIEGGL